MNKMLLQIIMTAMITCSSIAFTKNCTDDDVFKANALIRLAKTANQNGHYKKSIHLTEQSIYACSSNKNWHLLAFLKENIQPYQASLDAYLKAVSLAEEKSEKVLSLTNYGELAFMHGDVAEARYAIKRVEALSDKLPDRLNGLLHKIEKILDDTEVENKRGFERINTANLNEKLQNFSKYEKENIFRTLDILARNNQERYGQRYSKNYHSYLTKIIQLLNPDFEKNKVYEKSSLDQLAHILSESINEEQKTLSNVLVYLKGKSKNTEMKGGNDDFSKTDLSMATSLIENEQKTFEKKHQVKVVLLKFRILVTNQLKTVGFLVNDNTNQKQLDKYIIDNNHLDSDAAIRLFQAYNAFKLLGITETLLAMSESNRKIIRNIISEFKFSTV